MQLLGLKWAKNMHNMGDLCLVDELILELQRGQ